MKKLFAIVLTLILTFSSFGITAPQKVSANTSLAGTYYISAKHSGKVLTVENGNSGTMITQQDKQDSDDGWRSVHTIEEIMLLDSALTAQLFEHPEGLKIGSGDIQTYSVPSYAVKKALKWAINNTTSITNYVGEFFGKDAAVKVGNVMHTYVKPTLRKLERVENLTYGKMESAIYDAIEPVIGNTAARISAGFIIEAIQVLAPV